MDIKRFDIKLNFTSPILGSLPADPALLTKFIASKAPAPWQRDEETEIADDAERVIERLKLQKKAV